jgi:glycosyltransferase involved in cell wall biosynthesis
MKKEYHKKIIFWAPLLSHVGTINAVIGMADSFKKFLKYEVYIFNVFGEFDEFKLKKDYHFIDVFRFARYLPQTGKLSKIFVHLFSILSLPYFFLKIIQIKPNILISSLLGYLTNLLKFLTNKIIFINSIQGYPRFNYLRYAVWRLLYSKSDFIFVMTKKTRIELINKINLNPQKIFNINNPIISSDIRILANENLTTNEENFFKKKVFCSVGRLTKQKNFNELFLGLKKYSDFYDDNFNLIVIGEGEMKKDLENFIKKNNIKNFFLLGFKSNPYKYMARSSLYMCTSLWEEPGHTLIEAGYLNLPILTSNCPNGPDEIIRDNYNGFKYKLGNIEDMAKNVNKINHLKNDELLKIKINMKRTISSYTKLKFSKSIEQIIKI